MNAGLHKWSRCMSCANLLTVMCTLNDHGVQHCPRLYLPRELPGASSKVNNLPLCAVLEIQLFQGVLQALKWVAWPPLLICIHLQRARRVLDQIQVQRQPGCFMYHFAGFSTVLGTYRKHLG